MWKQGITKWRNGLTTLYTLNFLASWMSPSWLGLERPPDLSLTILFLAFSRFEACLWRLGLFLWPKGSLHINDHRKEGWGERGEMVLLSHVMPDNRLAWCLIDSLRSSSWHTLLFIFYWMLVITRRRNGLTTFYPLLTPIITDFSLQLIYCYRLKQHVCSAGN